MKGPREEQTISRRHPLRRLFHDLVWRRYVADRTLVDPEIAEYVAGVLTDFVHVDRLYRFRDARGRPLEEIGEMLLQSNPLLGGRSFDAERELRKHVGDFTLFFTGLFPEWLDSVARRRRIGVDAFVDYVKAGKESYAIVSEFNEFEYAAEAPLFKRLAQQFELCVFGLNLVRGDLQRLHRDTYRRISEELGGKGQPLN